MTDVIRLVYSPSAPIHLSLAPEPTPRVLTVREQGPPGGPGPQGEQGEPGVDGTGDATFTVEFTNQTSQVITHNLNKYVNVVFRDSAGTEYDVDVAYNSLNQCTVTWNVPTTGTITCN